jgi:AcrR family transcriptional regulator
MTIVEHNRGCEDGKPTRDLLVSTALRLFAEHGIDAVSLAQINRSAGQRNATASHYHFGGKSGLLQAIFDKHRSRVNKVRETMLAQLPDRATAHQVVSVLVLPLAEQVRDTDGGGHYLQFLAQLMNHSGQSGARLDQHDSGVLFEQQRRFKEILSPLAEDLQSLRMDFVVAMVFNSLARYASQVEQQGLDEPRHVLIIEQLVAAAVGALLSVESVTQS